MLKSSLKSVRKLRNSRVIELDYVPIAKNLAYQFTKGLSWNVINSASIEVSLRHIWWTILVITCSMWSDIPRIRIVKHTSFQSKRKDPCWFILNVHLFYTVCQDGFSLMCSNELKRMRNTPIWVRLLVTIYKIVQIPKYSWKGQEYELYAPTRGDAFGQPCISKGFKWNLFHIKLSILDLVHCSCVTRCSFCIRWMFNLTVSIETQIHQMTEKEHENISYEH
jgi:hypothetical protein